MFKKTIAAAILVLSAGGAFAITVIAARPAIVVARPAPVVSRPITTAPRVAPVTPRVVEPVRVAPVIIPATPVRSTSSKPKCDSKTSAKDCK